MNVMCRAARIVVCLTLLIPVVSNQAFAQSTGTSPAAAQQSAIGASRPSIFENLSLFAGLDGSKQPQDLGINANMGLRLAANWGFPVVDAASLGAQIGAAYNASDAAVHVLDQIEGTSRRSQTYLTAGLFQRPTETLHWGLAYDLLFQHYYDDFMLGQWRGQVGYELTRSNEVGMWFTKSAQVTTA